MALCSALFLGIVDKFQKNQQLARLLQRLPKLIHMIVQFCRA